MVEYADAGCGHPNHGNPDHDCKPFVSVGHGDQCDGCLMLAMVDRAERAEADAHNLAHEVDRIRERLWRLAARAGWRSGNPADNDATAELYIAAALKAGGADA